MDNNELTREAKEARNRYHREWRQRNKDRARAIQRRYWERVAEKQKQEE